jgi:hypothetical protein
MNRLMWAAILAAVAGQAVGDESVEQERQQSAARLAYMQELIARFTLSRDDGAKLPISNNPVLRWNNPRSEVVDGTVFVWLADGRPETIGGIWIKDGVARVDFHSLSAARLTANLAGRQVWHPTAGGVTWRPVEQADNPAPTRAGRLQQMRKLAQEFDVHAVKTAPDYDEGSIWRFRVLPRPIYRYAEEAAADGAIFAFAQGTDPEALLLLESRETASGPRWHFTFARYCGWELHARRGEREVWTAPKRPRDAESKWIVLGPFPVDPKLLPTTAAARAGR